MDQKLSQADLSTLEVVEYQGKRYYGRRQGAVYDLYNDHPFYLQSVSTELVVPLVTHNRPTLPVGSIVMYQGSVYCLSYALSEDMTILSGKGYYLVTREVFDKIHIMPYNTHDRLLYNGSVHVLSYEPGQRWRLADDRIEDRLAGLDESVKADILLNQCVPLPRCMDPLELFKRVVSLEQTVKTLNEQLQKASSDRA